MSSKHLKQHSSVNEDIVEENPGGLYDHDYEGDTEQMSKQEGLLEETERSINRALKRRFYCRCISFTVPCIIVILVMAYFVDHYSQFYSYEFIFSKITGAIIVAGSIFLYVPQISKILANSSADGVSVVSFYIEYVNFMQTVAFSYHKNFAFSVYGEFCF